MAGLKWNIGNWEKAYDWAGEGEEWSECWGNSETQWFGSIYPRIHRFIPCGNILEIAPGFGRWTKYLLSATTGQYWGVDMASNCIEHCQKTFADNPNATFSFNDGKNLDAVGDTKFDFIFSYDSLVHADTEVFQNYIPQILNKLNSGGVCFIHHSNLASLIEQGKIAADVELIPSHARDKSTSAEKIFEIVEQNGGKVIIQELLNWGMNELLDTFTVFGRTEDFKEVSFKKIINPKFMTEANSLRKHISPYCGHDEPS